MVRLIIPGTLPTLNKMLDASKRNKHVYSKLKNEALQIVGLTARSQLGPGRTIITPAVFSFTWYRPDRRTDPDNIMSSQKFFFDGLQKYGILANDGWGEIAGITHSFHVDKANPRVEIFITEGVERSEAS